MKLLTEINPVPGTVLGFLEQNPDVWCQGHGGYGMRDANGQLTQKRELACQACLGAILGWIYPVDDEAYNVAYEKLSKVFEKDYLYRGTIPKWNDVPGRTYDEVIAVVRKAGI